MRKEGNVERENGGRTEGEKESEDSSMKMKREGVKWEEEKKLERSEGRKEGRKEKSFGFLGNDKWKVVEECAHTKSEKDGNNKFKMDGGKPRRMKAQKTAQKKKK